MSTLPTREEIAEWRRTTELFEGDIDHLCDAAERAIELEEAVRAWADAVKQGDMPAMLATGTALRRLVEK